jgi:Sep15/SelM redox domain
LNRLPELKDFVMYGGAESFQNVEVEFVGGRSAVLTIYDDGEEREKIELTTLGTQQEMKELMLDKGFVLKSPQELARIKMLGATNKKRDEIRKAKEEKDTNERKEAILEEYRRRSETLEGMPHGDELTKLTSNIKKMKEESGGKTNETIVKMERRRAEILRQELLSRQYQLQMATEHKKGHAMSSGEL